jgi:hypothetical protein
MKHFGVLVARKYRTLPKRGRASAEEHRPPIGQAAEWYDEMIQHMPRSAMRVGRQLARLCGDDSKVTIPIRSLADAVGFKDSANRHIAYTQQGVAALQRHGWIEVVVSGQKRGAKTTYYLMVGKRCRDEGFVESEVLQDEDAAA